jgi:YVTN family beta-propeller protein
VDLQIALGKSAIVRIVLLGTIALGTFAGITRLVAAQTPSPALLITIQDPGERALAIADPLTMKVVSSVPMVGEPHEVAVSADGKLAFVTSRMPGPSEEEMTKPGNDYISVIDLAAQKELRRVETGPGSRPHGIVVAGGKVYFTCEGYQLIKRYDPARNLIDWELGIGQVHVHEIRITKDLNQIFTTNDNSDSVTAIEHLDSSAKSKVIGFDSHSPWKVTTIPVGHGPEGIAMSPDEKEVWALHRRDGGVSIIDVAAKKVSQTLDLNTRAPVRAQFTPDGKRVIIADFFSGAVLILDAVTRKEIKRIALGKPAGDDHDFQVVDGDATLNGVPIVPAHKIENLLIAPDGSQLYVDVMGSNRIDIIDLRTFEVTGSISVGRESEHLAWAERR